MCKRVFVKLVAAIFLVPISPFAQSEAAPPTSIPGVICRGQLLTVGLNEGGGFGVGVEGGAQWAGFQFPPGPIHESLAIFFWGEGWKISYKEREHGQIVDTTAWWQPNVGWPPPPANRFIPVSATQLRDDHQECLYEVVVRTTDKKLKIIFEFNFRKAYPSVVLTTTMVNVSNQELFDVVYARTADYDIHQNTSNGWSSNDSAAFACGNNPSAQTRLVMMSIAGYVPADGCAAGDTHVFYAEEFAWDDFNRRGPGLNVRKNRVPFVFDGHGSVHYKLNTLRRREPKKVVTVYSAAFSDTCPSGTVPGVAVATSTGAVSFSAADAKKVGSASQQQATAVAGRNVRRADTRKDRKLDEGADEDAADDGLFSAADANKDGSVSQGEAAAVSGLNFSTADTSKDGKLDKEEFEAAIQAAKNEQHRTTHKLRKYTFPGASRPANDLHIVFNVENVRTKDQRPFVNAVTKGKIVSLKRDKTIPAGTTVTLEFERHGDFTIERWRWTFNGETIDDEHTGPP